MEKPQGMQPLIVLAFCNEVIAEVYSLAFETIFEFPVKTCNTAAETAEVLRKNPDACVIAENLIPGGPLNAFLEIQAILAKRAHIFILGGGKELLPEYADHLHVEFLPERSDIKIVVERVEAALKLESSTESYCRITLKSLLVRGDKLQSDVFLKINDGKFVKVLHANEGFDQAEFDRFKAKNLDGLYLLRSDFLGLMEGLLSKAADLNRNPEKITLENSVNTNLAIFQTIHSAFETEGFTPQLQQLTQASVGLAINTIKKNPKLSDILRLLDLNRDSYLSWHSTAMGFLSCKLATLLGWQSDATFYKLSLASMLHDLTLNTDALAKIRTIEQLKEAGLSSRDKAAVLRHSLEAAQLLQGFDEIPGEVAFLVEQHHEQQDGSGFPRGVDAKDTSPISALFIISLDIVTFMYDSPPEKFQIEEFITLRNFEQCYTKGNFGQIFRALVASHNDL